MHAVGLVSLGLPVHGPMTFRASDPIADCHNQQPDHECNEWAKHGECDRNVGFMRQQCALACNSCGYVPEMCRGKSPPAKGIGGIHDVFRRAESMSHLRPKVHSRDPYVLTFDRFVTDEEAAAFITTTDHHFARSLAGDAVSPVRTSKQARPV